MYAFQSLPFTGLDQRFLANRIIGIGHLNTTANHNLETP